MGRHTVEVANEVDGLEVFAPAVAVGHPLAGLARIVSVQHRGHRIDAQPVDVEMLQPMQRRGHHEPAHLIAAQVDQRVPVLVVAFQRVVVLVQGRTVEARQAMFVCGKCAGTQSSNTPMPPWWQASMNAAKSSAPP